MANSIDMDALFNGATVTLNTVQNAADAIATGINDIRNSTNNSRRNMGPYQQNNPGYNNGYAQPVSYGYGYADNSGYGGGYGYPTNYPTYAGTNNYGGYPGFTNPGYGNTAGPTPTNRPQGGAWG